MFRLCNFLFVTVFLAYSVHAEGIGDKCVQNGLDGVCTRKSECARDSEPEFLIDVRWGSQCESNDVESVVCCVSGAQVRPSSQTSAPRLRTTTLDPGLRADPQLTSDKCVENGLDGVCKRISECATETASQFDVDVRSSFQCLSNDVERVVCCIPATPHTTTTPTPRLSTTTLDPIESQCEVLGPDRTTNKTGRIAWDKCIDYQRQLVYPCVRTFALVDGYNRINNCKHAAFTSIHGGSVTNNDEFPHMVQLGFGDEEESVSSAKWDCGGTLLSDWFILTAAHCTSMPKGDASISYYKVRYAVVGALQSLKTITIVDGYTVYNIGKVIKHPDYRPPSKYNDIALLKTETRVILSASAVPACLDIFGGDKYNVVATGWGSTDTKDYSDILLKVHLHRFTIEECQKKYRHQQRLMSSGVNETTQVCYGHRSQRLDTCPGDSGGPVTIRNPLVDCMYSVVGIVSNGRPCGIAGTPGIYTKVSHYVPWIESIVWADEM